MQCSTSTKIFIGRKRNERTIYAISVLMYSYISLCIRVLNIKLHHLRKTPLRVPWHYSGRPVSPQTLSGRNRRLMSTDWEVTIMPGGPKWCELFLALYRTPFSTELKGNKTDAVTVCLCYRAGYPKPRPSLLQNIWLF